MYFGYRRLIRESVCQQSPSFSRLSFRFAADALAVEILLDGTQSHFCVFGFVACALGVVSKNHHQDPCQEVSCLCFLTGVS